MDVVSPTFSCPNCGRKLLWKPEIAGKTGKCRCGTRFTAPPSLQEIPVAAPAQRLAPDIAGAAAAQLPPPLPPPLPSSLPAAAHIAYATPSSQTPNSAILSTDLLRDVYLPLAVLLGGFIAILLWTLLIHPSRHTAFSLAFMSLFNCVTLSLKAVVLGAIIWAVLRSNDADLGNPLSFALRIAGLLIFLDATETWIRTAIGVAQVSSAEGSAVAYFLSSLLVSFLIAFVVTYFVYGMSGYPARTFARIVAIGNWAMNCVLIFLLSVISMIMQHAAARARAIAAAPTSLPQPAAISPVAPPTSGAQATPPPGMTVNTYDLDRQIDLRAGRGEPFVFDARNINQTPLAFAKHQRIDALVNDLYTAGAQRVYLDFASDAKHTRAYVLLSADAAQRDQCFKIADDFEKTSNPPLTRPATPSDAKYLVILLK